VIAELPPAYILLAGALILPFLPARWRAPVFLAFPLAALLHVWFLQVGTTVTQSYLSLEVVVLRVDGLSRGFGLAFSFVTLAIGIYSLHVTDRMQQVAALLYAGGSLGVTFAGDFFTLLVYWEVMAVASTFLVWSGEGQKAQAAGFRYLMVHLFGGGLLLAGIVLLWFETGSLVMGTFEMVPSNGTILILAGVLVNAAVPPLHAWVPDSYPKATVTGAIFLSAFTTKVAVYVLAQCFSGWDLLLYVGAIMACYGVYYAVLAMDIRLILAYHIISQVGYMIAAIGLGQEFPVAAGAAHAYNNILYKSLLFMGAGAVLYSVGTSRLTELGGLGKRMPWVVVLYMIGAFSITGLPLFNGFVSKVMIMSATAQAHSFTFYLLLLATVGTFLSVGIKLPYYTWFYRESGLKPKPIPPHMLVAMVVLAVPCLAFGIWPPLLYGQLPFAVDFQAYSVYQVAKAIQVPMFTFVAFWFFRHKMIGDYKVALDTDWFYRRPAPLATKVVDEVSEVFAAAGRGSLRLAAFGASLARNPLELWRAGRRDYDPDRDRFPLGTSLSFTLLAVVVVSVVIILQ
jgi:multicomponent Na+:H+ antiporter subunit D